MPPTQSMISRKPSVSKFEATSWSSDAAARGPCRCRRSAAAAASASRGGRSNCMKTRFQNSRKRSQSQPGWHSERPQPSCSPRSKKISEHGPHGRSRRPARSCPYAGARRYGRAGSTRSHLDGDLVLASPSSGSPAKTVAHSCSGERHVLDHELPGEVDRAVLEVVAEREVAEHLEERAVPRRCGRRPRGRCACRRRASPSART